MDQTKINAFQDKLLVDDRERHWLQVGDYTLGFVSPKPIFFQQVLTLIVLQIAIANILAVVTYYGIIHNKQARYLVGFGVVIPVALLAPVVIMDVLDIRATVLRMSLICVPLYVSLRCLQAMFGTTPKVATLSMRNFQSHFGFLLLPQWDMQHQRALPATVGSFIASNQSHGFWLLVLSFLYSWLVPHSFEPFVTQRQSHEIFVSFELGQLVNNFICAVLVSLSLSLSMSGISALVQAVGGFQCEEVVNNPMFGAESPSDFWGRRWNLLIHTDLKNGVYKPVRSYTTSKSLATLATFLCSGLIHEYVWWVLFYVNKHQIQEECYVPPFGKSLLFFGWNGILVLFEHATDKVAWDQMRRTLPRPFVTMAVILMALPVGHLFTGDMVKGGYLSQLQVAFPLLLLRKS